MKKTILLLTLTLSILLCSCGGKQSNNSKNISDVVTTFKQNGFNVENESEMLFQIIGASDGKSMDLNGNGIEIYKFDTDDKGQKSLLENIEKTGLLTVLTMKQPAIVNGSFVLISYQDHPEKEKIIDCFNKFK